MRTFWEKAVEPSVVDDALELAEQRGGLFVG
jgi:hypothetical protein